MEKNNIKNELLNLKGSAILGIDGMIDEVWQLIDNRSSATEYSKMPNMMDFANSISARKTGGMAKERLLKRRISGGFVCNTGRAIANLGVSTSFLGMFGADTYDKLFDEFNNKVQIHSLGEPANINILEFSDGKIMMPNLENIINLKWENVIEKYPLSEITSILNKDIVGLGYWSNMYDFENILANIVKICKSNGKTKRILHDFANINKRTNKALLSALNAMKEQDKVLPQTLSLNEHEGAILCSALGVSYPKDVNNPNALNAVLNAVVEAREKTDIDEIVIHTLYFAVCASREKGSAFAVQNYCENPVKTTGAGDTFNGGYMAACLTALTAQEKLCVANATTYCYVSSGNAPTVNDVIKQLNI